MKPGFGFIKHARLIKTSHDGTHRRHSRVYVTETDGLPLVSEKKNPISEKRVVLTIERKMPIRGKKKKIIAIVGPTASGKSDLAVEIARFLSSKKSKERFGIAGAEVVSADSRQVYKGMDISTGKITKREMRGIPHHMLDLVSPKKIFTVTDYQKRGREIIRSLLSKKIVPIVCGGTGFYIDALIYETKIPDVPPNPSLRKKLSKKNIEELFEMVKDADPERAKSIDAKNPVRLIRAIEIISARGKVPKLGERKSLYNVCIIGIHPEKKELNKRIRIRLEKRIRKGMIREIEKLHSKGISWKRLDGLGLESRFISRFIRGTLSRKEMERTLEKEIRDYAKRQMTWFIKNKEIVWIRKKDDAIRAVMKFLS